MPGTFTFNGSANINCVKWDMGAGNGISCSGQCRDVNIRRTTMTGSQNGSTDFLKLSTTYGASGAYHTMRVEKSIIRGNRVAVLVGGGKLDKDVAAIEPGFAFVLRESIVRQPNWSGDQHSELISLVETADGVLIENNLLYCRDGNTCNTGVMLAQEHNGGQVQNVTIRGNRILGDSTGFDMTFDQDKSTAAGNGTSATRCVEPVQIINNVFETIGHGTWVYGSGVGTGCPPIASRPGSSCTGNTVNGAPSGC